MTPDTLALVRDFGLPLVALIAVSLIYYRSQQDVVKDLRAQRDLANTRADALIEGLRSQTSATTELTNIVREGFRREQDRS